MSGLEVYELQIRVFVLAHPVSLSSHTNKATSALFLAEHMLPELIRCSNANMS